MFTSTISSLLLLSSVALAQTPAGFEPPVAPNLEVIYGGKTVTDGQTMTKAETANQPSLAMSASTAEAAAASGSDTYIFMMIDLDVPSPDGTTARTTLLHAMYTDYSASSTTTTSTGSALLTSPNTTSTTIAAYIGPNPPAKDATHPHRYVQLLFPQPSNFSLPTSQASAVQNRIGFDLAAFMTAAGLDTPVAANFFLVAPPSNAAVPGQGGNWNSTVSAASSTGAAAATGTVAAAAAAASAGTVTSAPAAAASSVIPFTGVGAQLGRVSWVAGALAVVGMMACTM